MLVGLFLVVVLWALKVNKPISPYLIEPKTTSAPAPSGSPVGTASPTARPISYGDAVKQFTGRRVQFDQRCQAIPVSFTVKNNTQVMFDNRSGDARWFSLNGFGYHLSGFGFTIITLSSKKLPFNVVIDCGSAQNVGQILIQK